METPHLVQLKEGKTAREGEGLGHTIAHLLTRGAIVIPHLLLLLLPGPVAGGLRCAGRVVQGRDKIRPQRHPLAIQVVGHPRYDFQRQVVLLGQCELGPHVDSTVEPGNLGLTENRQ